jgi:hypothetical protein
MLAHDVTFGGRNTVMIDLCLHPILALRFTLPECVRVHDNKLNRKPQENFEKKRRKAAAARIGGSPFVNSVPPAALRR